MCSRTVLGSLLLSALLILSACGTTTQLERFNILEGAKPISLLTTQALATHAIVQNQSELSLQSDGPRKLDGLHLHTMTALDFYSEPFTTITLATPQAVGDIWSFASGLTGKEWGLEDFDGDYFTILSGATEVRDGLISVSPGLSLLMQLSRTLEAMGGPGQLDTLIGTDYQNFLLRDTGGQLWSIEETRVLTPDEERALREMYDDIYAALNTPEQADAIRGEWQDLLAQSEQQQRELGYDLSILAAEDGTLDLSKAQSLFDSRLRPQVGYSQRECWLFICSVVEWGWISDSRQVPMFSAPYRFGGWIQYPSQYGINGQAYFKTIWCISNIPTEGALGCGPSAFNGLLLRQFDLNHRFGSGATTKAAFLTWLVAPNGVHGRPRIANYMGTCRPTGTTDGLTTGGGFAAGATNFLNETNSSLKLVSNVSSYYGNGAAAADKARIIVQNIGRSAGTENPVVALYFHSFGQGHFSAISHYRNMWQGSIDVTIKTVDHNDRYWSLSGYWGTQRGVYTLVPK